MLRHPVLVSCAALLLVVCGARAQSFQNPVLIPTPLDPGQIATGDLNHDGIADLVYDTADINATGSTLHVLLGKGDGTYSDAQDIALTGAICCTINIADVTGDGIPDLVLGSGDSATAEIATLPGHGDGTFGAPVISSFTPPGGAAYPNTASKMGIGDINGDGAADLVIADPQNSALYVLTGNNTGTFQYTSTIFDGSGPSEVFLQDLNGDGHLDIVALGPLGGSVMVCLGKGDGTFASGTNYMLGPGADGIALTDLDGDGHPDIVGVAYQNSSNTYALVFLHGNPDGTFAALQVLVNPLQGTLIDVADYNGDGIPDLVVENQVGVGILLGKGSLTYAPVVSYISGGSLNASIAATPGSVAFGNFTSSGHRDIAMAVEGGIVELMGQGDGTFDKVPFYDLGEKVGGAAIADFDGDGNPDIAVTVPAEYPRVLLGTGNGAFNLSTDQNTSYGSTGPSLNVGAADFTGTHVQDLVALSSGGPVSPGTPEVFFGSGHGTFAAPEEEDFGSTAVADFNGDGIADTVSLGATDITVLLGHASGTFTTVTTPLRNPTFAALVALGDINGDRKPDLLISDIAGMEVWLGNGDGTFTYKDTLYVSPTNGYSYITEGSAAIADLDGDGKADIAIANPTGVPAQMIVLFYGNGDGTFQAPVDWPLSHQYTALTLADINGDGRPDLILNDGLGIAVIRNLGNRNFAPEEHYVAGASIGTVSIADLNHDGYPDIVATNSGGTTVAVLLNQPSIPLPGGLEPVGTLTVSPEPSAGTQPIGVTLTLAPAANGDATPTGIVSIMVDGADLGQTALNSGVASFTISNPLKPGTHTITAAYYGDANYRSSSWIELHTVNPPVYTTSTTLTVTPENLLTSQTVHMQVTVSATGPAPGGYVTILDGGQTLGAVQLNSSGIAYFDTALLSAGIHTISAEYDGFSTQDSYGPEAFLASTSAPVTVTVSDNSTSTTLSASPTTPTSGTVVTLTANVTSSAGTPFGGATFFDGTTMLGTASLLDGKAVFNTVSLAAGQHSLQATYNANATFGSSTSQGQSLSVQSAAASLIPTFTSVSEMPNQQGLALTANVSSINRTPQGAVTFLMDGSVLGEVFTNREGTATLDLSAIPASGQHKWWASYAGTSAFAPSASPALEESWQNGGPAFTLSLDTNTVSVSSVRPAQIHIRVVASSAQTTALSCASGLPLGYSCTFTPASLSGSGTATLTISAVHDTVAGSQTTGGWVMTLCLLAFLPALRRRGLRWLIVMIALVPMIALSGCSTPLTEQRGAQMSILVIESTSGSGSGAVIHSSQVTLRVGP